MMDNSQIQRSVNYCFACDCGFVFYNVGAEWLSLGFGFIDGNGKCPQCLIKHRRKVLLLVNE